MGVGFVKSVNLSVNLANFLFKEVKLKNLNKNYCKIEYFSL